ncbi:MAG: peptide chain release factor N(5)-glutamine methyltransferase [Rubricoccaceae bacterium]
MRYSKYPSRVPLVTRRALIDSAVARFRAADVDSPRRTAEWLLEDLAGVSRADLYARPDELVTESAHRQLEACIERRVAGEPLQYIVGHTEFYGLRIQVSPAVLIPRPETEEVVEAALATLEGVESPWVLDVGTGSGAIALATKAQCPDAEVFAADVSPAALALARENAASLDLDLTFVEADALSPDFTHRVPPTFHLVVSNPPYVPQAEQAEMQREVRDHEPDLALFVPDDDPLVFYRALARHACQILHPGGWLVVETHADGGEAVGEVFESHGLAEVEVLADLSGRQRMVRGHRPS